MWKLPMGTLGVAVMCLLAVGCQNQTNDEKAALELQNKDLQAQLADRDAKLRAAADPSQIQALQADLAQRDAKIKELESQLRQPTPGTHNPGIAGIETSYDASKGELTVTLPSSVLFDSGKATVKESAKATLNKVVAAMRKDYAGKVIRVEGHTDADPIVKTKDKWEDNLDLSLNRAAAVTRYLLKSGIKPSLVTTSGFGDTHPKASKTKSRRVEVVVVVK